MDITTGEGTLAMLKGAYPALKLALVALRPRLRYDRNTDEHV